MPGLRVHRSNRIEALAEMLITQMAAPNGLPEDPMKRVQIVVGSRGQERWLRHRIATDLGICAQVDFPFQQAFLSTLLDTILNEDVSAHAQWHPGTVSLAILRHLSMHARESGPLAHLHAAPNTAVTAQQLSSAQQIAQVFDRYGLYRPTLIRAWSGLPEPDPPRLPNHLQWQSTLWRGLAETLDIQAHFAARIVRAQEKLQSGTAPALDPIRVFGFAALPPAWLDFLGAVAQHTEVELFALCPSMSGWDQIRTLAPGAQELRGLDRERALPAQLTETRIHPLDQSLGRAARDTQIVIESLAATEHVVPIDETRREASEAPCALHHLQADILHGRQPASDDTTTELAPTDQSIQFHACHGPARQVEVIRDVVLGLLDTHPDLEPRDIVIMTPDIGTYAPLLEGAFGQGQWHRNPGPQPWGETGAPRLQVEVADLSVRRTNPVADALLRILAVAADRLTASAALDLITLEPVADRFGFAPADAGRLREIVIESGIRWGLDAEDRERSGHTHDDQNTFAFGLDRLALGVTMADEGNAVALNDQPNGALTPWDPAEQGDTLALLGRFFDFCEALSASVRALRDDRPIEAWIDHITAPETGTLERMTRTLGVSQWLTQRVREALNALREEAQAAQSQQPFALDALQALLEGRFEVPSRITRQQTGAVTCCALRPMRSVPYRVVCLIGMDEGSFPKQGSLPGFDWTGLAPRAGDKIPRDEDRLMLLEAILSARTHLVVTYTGRSVRTNQPCQPCVPIAELREVIDQSMSNPSGSATQAMTTTHALHSFSPANFHSTDTPPRSFDIRLLAAAEAGLGPRHDPPFLSTDTALAHAPRDPDAVIELQTLSNFFSNPARALLKQRFGLRLQEFTVEVEDQVPVELNGRDQRHIQRDLLNRTLLHMEQLGHDLTTSGHVSDWLAPVIEHMRSKGGLPPGPAGHHVLAPQLAVLSHLCTVCEDLLTAPETPTPFRIPLTIQGRTIEVIGRVPNVRNGAIVTFLPRADSGNMWWLIEPWIALIAWMAHAPGPARRMGIVHAYDKDGPALQFRVFGPDWSDDVRQARAQEMLQWMVEQYLTGMQKPLALFPQSSFQFAWGIQGLNKDQPETEHIIPDVFEDPDKHPSPERLSAAMKLTRRAWGTADSRYGDSKDVHTAHLYNTSRPFLSDETAWPMVVSPTFAAKALRLWQPILDSRQMISLGKKGLTPFLDALTPPVTS